LFSLSTVHKLRQSLLFALFYSPTIALGLWQKFPQWYFFLAVLVCAAVYPLSDAWVGGDEEAMASERRMSA